VKTTVDLPDDLYRRAKAQAALRGRKFKELVEEGLRLVLATSHGRARTSDLDRLIKRASGVIDSGVGDLASNPRHLAGYGRDERHR
jgi:hypothetical protein